MIHRNGVGPAFFDTLVWSAAMVVVATFSSAATAKDYDPRKGRRGPTCQDAYYRWRGKRSLFCLSAK